MPVVAPGEDIFRRAAARKVFTQHAPWVLEKADAWRQTPMYSQLNSPSRPFTRRKSARRPRRRRRRSAARPPEAPRRRSPRRRRSRWGTTRASRWVGKAYVLVGLLRRRRGRMTAVVGGLGIGQTRFVLWAGYGACPTVPSTHAPVWVRGGCPADATVGARAAPRTPFLRRSSAAAKTARRDEEPRPVAFLNATRTAN